jgi:hypothetical protein
MVARGELHRIERLDFLAATMDFVLHYDAAAMLLAENEAVDRAIAGASAAGERGDLREAARVARAAYAALVEAGMHEAAAALTRKLTTRCDFGVLCTFSVKALPLYWETIGRLEGLMPVAPPREVACSIEGDDVRLSWTPDPRARGQRVYRRGPSGGAWTALREAPLAASTRVFVDRPGGPGEREYSVTSLGDDGWESPRSHPVRADPSGAPRIVGEKPAARLAPGDDLVVDVVVVSAREIACVELCVRAAGAREWTRVPMHRRCRDAYAGRASVAERGPVPVEFFVEAADRAGARSTWPAAARAGVPWSVVVDAGPAR